MNIEFVLMDIELNSKVGCAQSPLLEKVLSLVHNNDTAVAKALSFLSLVAREKTRLNDRKANAELAPRAIELNSEGMNKCPWNVDRPLYENYCEKFII